ncbi:class I SAM-dependent methyltransferase [Embleya sp. AB8]|uniref:class I SAM-dependent methyltransferase n=1 Tax=Embleya sp. AB8 TaxID=3156304 RepID=UPI003C70E281
MTDRSTSPDIDRVLARRSADGWTFLREAARDLRTVGAVAPSGRALARLLTDPVDERGAQPLRVLEAGAGTGSVTRVLLPRLSPGSRLDLVEANPRFAARLCGFTHVHGGRVRVHHTFVEEFDTDHRYDVIVSGLPFTNFTPDRVERILDRYLDLLAPGGVLTYFAYPGTRHARALIASRTEARRHRAVEDVLANHRRRHATSCRIVWPNLPPAKVWRLHGRPAAATPAPPPPNAVAGATR